MKKLIVTIALGAAVVATPALAQGQGGGFGQRDQTRADAQQRADTMFQMLDANHDGTVTRAEAQQALAQFEAARGGGEGRGAGRIQRMIDLAFGTSQTITLQQFEAQALARFDAMDLNHDGTVTAAERQQARQLRAQAQTAAAAPAAVTPPAAAVPPPPRQ
jgi:Ca2+-binding EF-hand superfamily protein